MRAATPLISMCWATLLLPVARAQAVDENPYVIQLWQVHDDLPHNHVRDVVQTGDGQIWVATPEGIARYTGRHFGIQFDRFHSGNTEAIPNNFCSALAADAEGGLWAGLDTGQVVRRVNNTFTLLPSPGGWPRAPIVRIVEAAPGSMVVLSREGVWAEFSADQPAGLVRSSSSGAVVDLIRDAGGTVWVVRESGLEPLASTAQEALPGPVDRACTANAGGLWVLAGQHLRRGLEGRWVEEIGPFRALEAGATCLLETRDGDLLVGTHGQGVWRVTRGTEGWQCHPVDGTTSYTIGGLCEDHEGNIWVAMAGGGLARLAPRRAETVTISSGGTPVSPLSVIRGPGDGLWVSTWNAELFYLSSNRTDRAALSSELTGVPIRSLQRAEDGAIWLGTGGRGLWVLSEGRCFPHPGWPWARATVHCLYRSPSGTSWAGLADGLAVLRSNRWVRVEVDSVPIGDDVRCLAEDTAGSLWCGTSGAGLARIQGQTLTRFGRDEGLGSVTVHALLADADGTLWVGTQGGGLARARNGSIANITSRHGLPHDTIGQILDDGQGRLWLASLGGLVCAEKSELTRCADGERESVETLLLDLKDGFTAVDFGGGNQPTAAQTADHRLWFVAGNGLGVVDPNLVFQKRNLTPPPVIIERVLADDVETAVAGLSDRGQLRFEPGTERLEFHYNALSYVAPRRVRFQYRLLGVDKDWVDVGSTRSVRFARLPPGHYSFQVKGCNNDGVWNEEGAQLAFTLAPHLWQTGWFRIGAVGVGVALIAGAVYAFTLGRHIRELMLAEQREALERERGRIARDMHDEVGAKLTRITVLSRLATRGNPLSQQQARLMNSVILAARECVRKFDQIVWTVDPRNDPLQDVVDYVAQYAVSYFENTGIECRLNIPGDLPDVPLSATVRNNLLHACEEAMSNVLKHSGARTVGVDMSLNNGALVVTVKDDGAWLTRPADHPDGDGLDNMQRRMSDVGGLYSIENTPDSGTTVRFEINLPKPRRPQ